MKILKIMLVLGFACGGFMACSTDDSVSDNEQSNYDITSENKLKLLYQNPRIETDVFDSGISEEPEINWDGKEGIVTLEKGYPGIDVDASTGEVFWNSTLGLGVYFLTVKIDNGLHSKTRKLVLDVRLGGNFKIKYNSYSPGVAFPNEGFEYGQLRFSKEGSIFNDDFPLGAEYLGKWSWVDAEHIQGYYYLKAADGSKVYRNFSVKLKEHNANSRQVKFQGQWSNHTFSFDDVNNNNKAGGYLELELYHIK
ncbi:hypothetical protein [Formosa sp. A9]|uniref:hypothetical protein n=1 Tax=Formosa sp. A9 TaxID=3442641 RepID=UPI003EBD40B4